MSNTAARAVAVKNTGVLKIIARKRDTIYIYIGGGNTHSINNLVRNT